MNRRRKLVRALGTGMLTAPFSALAQQPSAPAGAAGKVWRVGILGLTNRTVSAPFTAVLVRRLRELGYVEGGNLVIEDRNVDGDSRRLPAMAAELVQSKVDLIIAIGSDASIAAKAATRTIPIVMPITNDPVGNGIINSLARPGGNITDLADMSTELGPKRLEMLLAMTATKAPRVTHVGMLGHSAVPATLSQLKLLQEAGSTVGVTIVPVYATTTDAIEQAFASLRRQRATALILLPQPFFTQHRTEIARLAAQHRLPVSAPYGIFAEAGCLLSYGLDLFDNWRRAATFVDKIFKGAKPADLPVEQPVKFELVINGKTAKALGLKIPYALLILANRVIE